MNRKHDRSSVFEGSSLILLAAVCLFVGGCAAPYGAGHGTTRVVASARYGDLDSWGTWAVDARFGEIWYPYVDPGWAPFMYGNWEWTDRGWLWVSYEPYGWLVFHYGSWYYDPSGNWFWIPGDDWSAAPVDWCVYDDYVGWAPLPPAGVTWPDPWQVDRITVWTVVAQHDFDREDVGKHRVYVRPPKGREERSMIFQAPEVRRISQVSNREFHRVDVTPEKTDLKGTSYIRARLPHDRELKVEKHRRDFERRHPPQSRTRQKEKGHGGERFGERAWE